MFTTTERDYGSKVGVTANWRTGSHQRTVLRIGLVPRLLLLLAEDQTAKRFAREDGLLFRVAVEGA
jgi:hypothetical protein